MEEENKKNSVYLIPASVVFAALVIAGAWVYTSGLKYGAKNQSASIVEKIPTAEKIADLENAVLPAGGIILPVEWGDLSVKMIEAGVIDAQKFEAVYAERGGLSNEMKMMLYGKNNGEIKMNQENSGVILNFLWALGLGNKNEILEKGPMVDPQYNGGGGPPASGFASTGGWTLSVSDSMEHYSRHNFVNLMAEQQAKVERVSKGIYRPCCGNATYFPDCNHGMAMLGLLELMAAQNVSEEEMYKVALQVNSYWFPDTYITIAQFLNSKGMEWNEVDPKEILGAEYSSGQGFRNIKNQVAPVQNKSGGGCGV